MEIFVAILCVVVGMFIERYYTNYITKQDAKKKASAHGNAVAKGSKELKEILTMMNVQIDEENGNDFVIRYQGGTFLFQYKPEIDAVDIIFPTFETFGFDHYQKAEMAANSLNITVGGWVCYLMIGEKGVDDAPVRASLSYRVSLMGEQAAVVNMLLGVLQSAFGVAREFTAKFEEEKKNNTDWNAAFLHGEFDNKIALVRNKLEIGHGELREEELEEEGALKLASLLGLYIKVDWGCPREMRILQNGKYKVIHDVNEMMAFDTQEFIKQQHKVCDLKEVSILACFENSDLQINLYRMTGCTAKTLFYQMTLNKISHTSDSYSQQSDSLRKQALIEIRLTEAKDDYWEAKYMIDDAQDKQKAARYSDLSDEQKMILALSDSGLQSDLYWGKKYYNAKCYLQALAFFKHIFLYYRNNWRVIDDERKGVYFEVCFYIGFIYMELNMREEAFYYLFSAKADQEMAYIQEYINCLCNMHDPFAINVIQSYRDQTIELLNGEKEGDEGFIAFFQFLNRRLAYTLIEMKDYDGAEKLLNEMIKNGTDVEFAKEELEYIISMRKIQQLNNKV